MRIDAHQHFWNYDAAEYPWIGESMKHLRRDFLPPDLARAQAKVGLDGSIAVQARQSLEESRWLLGLADESAIIRGVVGWVDLQSATVGRDLAGLARHPRFVGVRHVVQDEPDNDFMLRPDFLRGLGELSHFNLAYDLLIFPKQLPAAIQLVDRHPQLPFVLDHLAKPLIAGTPPLGWRHDLAELARRPNVHCKFSGLVTEVPGFAWTPELLWPYFDVALETFGAGRLMFGSDWPVCLVASDYTRWHRFVASCVTGLAPGERDSVLGGTAVKFYRLNP